MRCTAQEAPARASFKTPRSYLAVVRFHYHCSFVIVLLGVLTVTRNFTLDLVSSLAMLYVSFNVLLYGGLYTVNAIADSRSDRLHPSKRKRPVASGAIAPTAAAWIATALITAGFATAMLLFDGRVIGLYAAFVAVNLTYSFLTKRVAGIELLVNAATYPLRYLLGACVAGGTVSAYLPGLVFLVAIGACALRRSVEGSPQYSRRVLLAIEVAALAGIGLLRLLDHRNYDVFYYCAAGTFVVLVFGTESLPPMRRAFLRFWTR